MKLVKKNTGVTYHYEILDEYVAGVVLTGAEVKPMKNGFISFVDSYVTIENNKPILRKLHVNLTGASIYRFSKFMNLRKQNETRDRELLLKKYEIEKIKRDIEEKRLSVIPLEVSMDNALIKIKIGVCKGKKLYEKKNIIKERDIKREMDREMKFFK